MISMCRAPLSAAPLPLIVTAPIPAARRPPLPLAIENAQRVRLGQLAAPGAWRGCGRCVHVQLLAGIDGSSSIQP